MKSKRVPCVTALIVLALGVFGFVLLSGASGAIATQSNEAPAVGEGPVHWDGPDGTFGTWGTSPLTPVVTPVPVDPAADPPDNLTNPGNGEIMPTTHTHLIFWLPAGFHYSEASDAAYENQIIKYFQDVGGSQILNTTTQYSGNNGSPADTSNFVDSVVDTTAYPHQQPAPNQTGTAANPLKQGDLNTEVSNQITANGWSLGLSDMYFVFLPNGVVDCNNAGTQCNTNTYCAYHTFGFQGGTNDAAHDFIWADIPDNRSPTTTLGGCGNSNVTGNPSADTTLSSTEHEHMEAITDPRLNAWMDSTGAENGDKCNRNMGVANASSTTPNNYLGAGNVDKFRIQREWSNAVSGCAASFTTTGSGVESPAPSGSDVTDTVAEATTPGNPSDNLDYTLTFTNPSNQDDAYNITVTDTLPAGVQLGGSGTVTFNLGDLAPHQTATRTFTAHPTGPLAAGTVLTNSAQFNFNDSTGTAQPSITRTASTTVVNAPPTLSLPGPQSVDFNDSLSFGVSASDAEAGDTLTLSASGLPAGLSFTDNGNGTGTVSGTDTADPAVYTTTFSVDDHHNAPVTGTVQITVNQEDSQVTYTGALTQDYHDPFTASVTLRDPDGGAPIANKPVTFTLGGVDTCGPVMTNGSGVASCSITPTQAAGTVNIAASFAGDTDYVPSSDTQSFAITKEETTTTYTGPTVILQGASGVTLKAQLLEDGTTAPVPFGQTITLSLGGQSCTGTTDASGVASCTLVFNGALGPQPLSAVFAGDPFYRPSSDTGKTAIVFAFPSRGAFVLGDNTVAVAGPATTVTWWSNSWAGLDSLSGGLAPAAFKGFAGKVSLPTSTPPAACGGLWTTRPGDSEPPVSGVPSYMGVIAASSVTKSGSTISGDTVKIVVVLTNPGYAPDPGHPGTGTIVATFC